MRSANSFISLRVRAERMLMKALGALVDPMLDPHNVIAKAACLYNNRMRSATSIFHPLALRADRPRMKMVSALVDPVLEPHMIVKAAHLLKDLVAEGALEHATGRHVQCADVAARVIIVGEGLTALQAAHNTAFSLVCRAQLGTNRV
jgi:hypothetical protein